MHHKAEAYDLGIYFEANGHGTVLFSDALLERFTTLRSTASGPAAAALDRILAASELINQAVGDAMSDALFVEAVLALKGWSVQDWDGMYNDLPRWVVALVDCVRPTLRRLHPRVCVCVRWPASRQTKLPVEDRTAVKPIPDETRLNEPAALQAKIDELVAAVPSGRAFTRYDTGRRSLRCEGSALCSHAACGVP